MSTEDWREAIDGFPGMACVLFASRCARRTQPLFLVSWPEAPQRLYQLLDGALETVDDCVRGADRTNSTFAFNAMSAVKAASRAGAKQASLVASTVACATYTMTAVGYGNFPITHAAQAAEYSLEVFSFGEGPIQVEGLRKLKEAMASDLSTIRTEIENNSYDDFSPLPGDLLGPIWPGGDPDYVTQLPTVHQ